MPNDQCHRCDMPMLPSRKVCPNCGWVRPSKEEAADDLARMLLFGVLALIIIVATSALKIGF